MSGIIEINVHGKNVEEAINEIKRHLDKTGAGTYRIRVIRGTLYERCRGCRA